MIIHSANIYRTPAFCQVLEYLQYKGDLLWTQGVSCPRKRRTVKSLVPIGYAKGLNSTMRIWSCLTANNINQECIWLHVREHQTRVIVPNMVYGNCKHLKLKG